MWKDYSAEFIKRNKASSAFIVAAAFISALFLSLLCGLFYNFWIYEVESVTMEEGDWQGRIAGVCEDDIEMIRNFANVEKAEINGALSEGENLVADVWFSDMDSIYHELPLIAEKLGLDEGALSYHELLLSRYMIHDPNDPAPPLLMGFFLILLLVVSVSLILIIHNAFAVSMDARIHQFGILSSIGAAPGQIFACLMQEAAALCFLPVLLGSGVGIAGSAGILALVNFFAAKMPGRHEAVFEYHPIVFVLTMAVSALTVFFSACLPAKKLSRLTPLEAIRGTGDPELKKKKRSRVLSMLFGIEGELAGNALAAQKKALRTSTLSLTLSFLGFTVMLCFFTLAGISTRHTYFERYQDAWDVMVTLEDTEIGNFAHGQAIRDLDGVESSVVYQKAQAVCLLPESGMSGELLELGGLETVAGSAERTEDGDYMVEAPLVIMDDPGFEEYCRQLGVAPGTDGAIVLNRIWDSIHSNFRYKEYVSFLNGGQDTVTLQNAAEPEHTTEIPVLAYTQETPVLREEYANYALVQILPLSLWEQIGEQIGGAEADTYIRILGTDGATLSELNVLQDEILQATGQSGAATVENRVQEKITDDAARHGMMVIFGAFCVLLAAIGIANVFSNTLGFLRQRRREFARYASVGMTPQSMQKMFFIEALVIAGRPLLVTLPITVAVVAFMITASYLDPMEFLAETPVVPVLVFIFAIFVFVGLAYYVGGRRMLRCGLSETLRNENTI